MTQVFKVWQSLVQHSVLSFHELLPQKIILGVTRVALSQDLAGVLIMMKLLEVLSHLVQLDDTSAGTKQSYCN